MSAKLRKVPRFAKIERSAKLVRLICKAYRKNHRVFMAMRTLQKALNLSGEKATQFLKLVEDTLKDRSLRNRAEEARDMRVARLWMEMEDQHMPYSCCACNKTIEGEPIMKDGRGVCADCAGSQIPTNIPTVASPMSQRIAALHATGLFDERGNFVGVKEEVSND